MEAEIINPLYYSLNRPGKIENEIVRDNIISTITGQLKNNDIVLITGEEGIGKTTFIYQFAKANSESCVASFIKPINQFSSNIDNIIDDLIGQIHYYIKGEEYSNQYPSNIDTLTKIFGELIKKTKGKSFYILIDGLENMEERNTYQLKALFDNFPIGYNIKFLFSENNEKVLNSFLKPSINVELLLLYAQKYERLGLT